MKLSEIFNSLPEEMKFRSHFNGKIHTAKEWSIILKDDTSEAKINETSYNYGKDIRKTIYFPRVGPAFTEVPSV